MYLTLLNLLCSSISLISGQITSISGYVLVPMWPDNRGPTVFAIEAALRNRENNKKIYDTVDHNFKNIP